MSNSARYSAIVLLSVGMLVLSLAAQMLSAAPRPGNPVLLIGASAESRMEAVNAVNGQVIGPVQAPLATLADGLSEADLDRLTQFPGIWAVVDGRLAELVCGALNV